MRGNPDVKAELEGLAKAGLIAPKSIVEAARDPDSALHTCFTWDDSEAGEKWRIEEARRLLRVYVVRVGDGDKSVMTRAFVSLSSDRTSYDEDGEYCGGYRAIVSVLSDEELKAQLLQDALDEFENFKLKFDTIQELKPVFLAAEKVTRKHRKPVEQERLAA